MSVSTDDKLIGLAAIMVIIITFGWCAKLLLSAPIIEQIKIGTKSIQSGISAENKVLINQK